MSIVRDNYGYVRFPVIVTVTVTAIAAFMLALVLVVQSLGVHYGRVNCSHYATATSRPAKFVRYSYWTWDCLTPNPSQPGTWIPIDQLRGVK